MEKFPGQLSTDVALETLKESSKFSQHRSVLRQDNLHGSILSYSNSRYVVDLAVRTCTCRRFQVNGIPCGHDVALIYQLRGQPRDFIPTFFSRVTYRDTYGDNVKAIDANISSLLMSEERLSPNLNMPRGRPKEKRLREGERKRRDTI